MPVTGDLAGFRHLDVRVANDPAAEPAGLGVRVVDAAGRVAVLPARPEAVAGWPGEGLLDRVEHRTGTATAHRAVARPSSRG